MSADIKPTAVIIDVLDPENGMPKQYNSTVAFQYPESSRITTKLIDQSSIDVASYSGITKTFFVNFACQFDKDELKAIIKAFADSVGAEISI